MKELFNAIRQENIVSVKMLLTAQPELIHAKDGHSSTPLLLATDLGYEDITKVLLSFNPDLQAKDNQGNTALMGVCYKGYTNIANMLIKAGAEIDEMNFNRGTALSFAAIFGREEIAKLLMAAGADPSLKDQRKLTPVDHAKTQELKDIMTMQKV